MPRATLAKLAAPRAADVVVRERVFKLFDDPQARAFWIAAPAGAGKSTLLASYLGGRRAKCAWLRLDEDDSDPATFLTYLGQSVGGLAPKKRLRLPLPDPKERPSWQAVARNVARAALSVMPEGSALVIDDVHKIESATGGLILEALVNELPPGRRIFLASRDAPPEALALLTAKRELRVMNWDDIRFDAEESGRLLEMLGCRQAPQALHEMSQGWAAGLVLLAARGFEPSGALNPAEVMLSPQESALSRQSPASPQVAGFFALQVFEGLSEPVRDILLAAAPMGEFSDVMAAIASGRSSAPAELATLAGRRLFVERIEVGLPANWYRMHPMFQAFLREELANRRDAEGLGSLLQTCARLSAEAGHAGTGIRLALEAGQPALARDLLLACAPVHLRQGRADQLVQLCDAVMAAGEHGKGWLSFWRGMACSHRDEAGGRRLFDFAFREFEASGDRAGQLVAAACAIEAAIGAWQSFEGMEGWFDAAIRLQEEMPSFADAALQMTALAGCLSGCLYLGARDDIAGTLAARLIDMLEQDIDPNVRLTAGTVVITHCDLLRNHDLAERIIARLMPLADDVRVTPYRFAYWYMHIGEFAHYSSLQSGKTEAQRNSGRWIAKAAEVAAANQIDSILFRIKRVHAGIAWHAGDIAAAEALMDEARPWLNLNQPGNMMEYHNVRCQLALLKNDVATAIREVGQAQDIAERVHAPKRVRVVYWTLAASVLIRQRRYDEALDRFALAKASSGVAYAGLFDRAMALAEACRALTEGQPDLPERLADYFARARATSAYQTSQFNSDELNQLAHAALERGIEVEYAQELIRRRRFKPLGEAPALWPWAVRIRTLGSAEIRINDEALKSTGKAQRKPLELINLLAGFGETAYSGVAVDRLIESLWPDVEAEDPKGTFDITLHRLRKLLGVENALVLNDGRLAFNRELVWTDAAAFERTAQRIDKEAEPVDAHALSGQLIDCYRGPFMNGEEESWAFAARERLRARFISAAGACGVLLEERHAWQDAIRLYERALAQDNLVEPFYRGLMRAHLELGEKAEGLRAYRRCRELLSIVLSIRPADETEYLHQSLSGLSDR